MRLKVLFIEDDLLLQKIVDKVTEVNGHPIDYHFSPSIANAKERLLENTYDAVVSDYYLQDGNASQILSEVKHLPVIIITGAKEIELAVDLMKGGACDYLVKDSQNKFIKILPDKIKNLIEINKSLSMLKAEELRYRDLFDNTSDLIQCVDESGEFIYTSPSWHKLLGFERDELKGITFKDIVHSDDLDHCTTIFQALRNGELKSKSLNVRFVGKNGEIFPLTGNVSATDLYGKGFATRGIFKNTVAQKITENLLKDSEEKYRELLKRNKEVICRMDDKGTFLYVNTEAEKLTGRLNTDIIGMHFNDIVREDYQNSVTAFYKDQLEGGPEVTYYEFPITNFAGETIWIGQKAVLETKTVDGAVTKGFTLFLKDITGKKLTEKKIIHQSIKLEYKKKEARRNYKKMLKAKASKKSLAVVLIVAIIGFFAIDLFFEPLFDQYFTIKYADIVLKGFFVLGLIPLHKLLRKMFVKKTFSKKS